MFKNHNSLLLKLVLILMISLSSFYKTGFQVLAPVISYDLNLTFTESADVNGLLSILLGVSSLLFSGLADLQNTRKSWLVFFVICFSLGNLSVGFISDLRSILIVKSFLAIAVGPIVPLVFSIYWSLLPSSKRGFYMGIAKGVGPLMTGLLAPMILITIVAAFHWSWGFYFLGLVGFILAFLLWKLFDEPFIIKRDKPNWIELKTVFKNRNIILCLLISICYMTSLMSFIGFAPLYLTMFKQLAQGQISLLLMTFAVGSFIWFWAIPTISDKIGRRPTLMVFALFSVGLPVFMAYSNLSLVPFMVCILLLSCATGILPLFDSIIPLESVSNRYAATVMAAIILTGEAIGGAMGSYVMGLLSDKYSLHTAFMVGAVAAFCAFLLSLGIKETKTP